MKKVFGLFLLLALLPVFSGCGNSEDKAFAERVHKDYEQRKNDSSLAGCFPADNLEMPEEQRASLEFLYAYMALPDIVDYSVDFYVKNVEAAYKARTEMPWGATVPEREFRHFVLPPRVNNENMDLSRIVFYDELKERVKSLSMTDAILEVNRWCHEKVTYQPSDGRTSSPLASVKSAIGRCGEESTFTVAALRSVGIPARQVYTPRWAHTDDNHAWVEAWADGSWYFLGACEPEPVLNLGWFNDPAARGMMMHTRVIGPYDGPEEVIEVLPCNTITVINVTSNYAKVAETKVKVVDVQGTPVKNADVQFSIYNYANYYPLAIKKSDENGETSLKSGLGDLVVWAYHNGSFGYKTVSAGKSDAVVEVVLDKDGSSADVVEWNLVPPMAKAVMPDVTDEMRRDNDIRKAREDSIRMAYVGTFCTEENAKEFARKNGYDEARVARVLVESRGNHETLKKFLAELPDTLRARGLRLLEVIAEKDRRDITPEILADFVTTPDGKSELHDEYVLNPRILTEGLTPYRKYFNRVISVKDRQRFRENPQSLVEEIGARIVVDTVWNPQNLKMSPESAWAYGIADSGSRNILFVAMARTLGIPARIDPVSGRTQWANEADEWINVDFDGNSEPQSSPTGKLMVTYNKNGYLEDPCYYMHFSLSEIVDGKPRLMEFPDFGTLSGIFEKPVDVAPGQYLLTSGQRMANGSVLARSVVFNVPEGETTVVPLEMRSDTTGIEVIGNFNSESIFRNLATGSDCSLLSVSGRGYYVLALVKPGAEPTVHALRDISLRAQELDKLGRSIFIIADDEAGAKKVEEQYPGLPAVTAIGNDVDGQIAGGLEAKSYPVVVIADTFNRVVFRSDGYSVNLGDRLADTLARLLK